ncbi:hypothetical protein HYFRA_00007602 [Hymenoscyphus fraxineus]|uniref:Heterokaryon incompatibility domain-containing protein n=1 Tax=Hymenoscyphus fraxineus TaxID=746836 RepID=A0A9N9KUH5_9HELO|nr:hypothetical protein HYFRA_00007602 [Hymenoscyphus fraxineus]
MRLLNTSTLTLEEFYGAVPKYAILSHRWEKEEVSFQAMNAGRAGGYEKINRSCSQAMDDGLRYIWVDTCCIDKTSSAELSEAINSMFLWYRNAEVCYAYLSDVDEDSELSESLWFTRGWTLQELLAPSKVVFYGHGWTLLGTRESLKIRLSDITGISSLDNFQSASIAQKMSWASKRITTRVEDMAYCLLGLFGIYMPPLYGEGKNAFLRLQLEILSTSDDESIFAWTEDLPESGMLASSPASFCDSGDVVQMGVGGIDRLPYYMTNKGLRVKGNAFAISFPVRRFQLPINCRKEYQLAITLGYIHGDQYYRLPRLLVPNVGSNSRNTERVLYVRQRDFKTPYLADGVPGRYEFLFKDNSMKGKTGLLGAISRWGAKSQLETRTVDSGRFSEEVMLSFFISPSLPGNWAVALYETEENSLFGIMVYFDEGYHVGIHALSLAELGLLGMSPKLSTGRLRKEMGQINEVSMRPDSTDLGNGGSDAQPGVGAFFADKMKAIVKKQAEGADLTHILYLTMEATFRRLINEEPREPFSQTVQLATSSPVITVHCELKEGPHLGRQCFEVVFAPYSR